MERSPLPADGIEPRIPEHGIRRLRLKVAILVALIPTVIAALVVYALYAHGVFERYRTVALLAHNAEGVSVGMPVSFSGFAIGNVASMAMTQAGQVRIDLRIREADAHWLRTSSVFTLEKQLIGSPKIRVTSPNMQDPPLPKNAVLELTERDAAEAVPQMVAKIETIIQSIDRLIRPGSSLDRSLANLRVLTERMSGEYGVLEGVTGNAARARQLMEIIGRLDSAAKRIDALLAKTDERIFGDQGTLDEVQRSLKQINAILASAQTVTSDLKSVSGNVNEATTDLVTLRADVEDSLRKVNQMLSELNRKWPFSNEPQIKLP